MTSSRPQAQALELEHWLELVTLRIIALGRSRCGSGFGKYPLGVLDAVDELMPRATDRVRAAYADFQKRLEQP